MRRKGHICIRDRPDSSQLLLLNGLGLVDTVPADVFEPGCVRDSQMQCTCLIDYNEVIHDQTDCDSCVITTASLDDVCTPVPYLHSCELSGEKLCKSGA